MNCVDIIMPTYNCEKYVKDAIESVKSQTYRDWNLIIIDDGSDDNTLEQIQDNITDIEEKVMLIKLSRNRGVANARNIGIEKSNNRYIAFLDADDIWRPEKLEKQIKYMEENEYKFTYTRYTYLKEQKEKEVKIFPQKLTYEQALKNTFILTSTVIIDTNYIRKELIKMPNVKSEDTATWWNILKKGNVSAYGLDESLLIYRITLNGLSSNKIKNLGRTWNLYRKQEKLSFTKSIYCFMNYMKNAILKRIL